MTTVQKAALSGIAPPSGGKVTLRIEISADFNISAFAARQKANRFLVMQAGDQFMAGDPEITVGPALAWRLPAQYAPSRLGVLGTVGHLLVDATNGEVTIADGGTTDDFMAVAEALYARSAPDTGT